MRKILSQPPFGEDVVSVLEMPLVESVPAEDSEKLRGALETKKFQWIVVTSPEAAKVFTKAWLSLRKSAVEAAASSHHCQGLALVLRLEIDKGIQNSFTEIIHDDP